MWPSTRLSGFCIKMSRTLRRHLASMVARAVTAFGLRRGGLYAGRSRATTQPPSDSAVSSSPSPTVSRPSRPTLKRRTQSPAGTTVSPASASAAVSETLATSTPEMAPSTGRAIIGRGRPLALRPGARLNLGPKLRSQSSEASTSEAPTSAASVATVQESAETQMVNSTTETVEPFKNRLRSKLRLAPPSPKPRVAIMAPVRRPSALIHRGSSSTETASFSEIDLTTESSVDVTETGAEEQSVVEPAPATQPPARGINALLARRRGIGGGAIIKRRVTRSDNQLKTRNKIYMRK